MSFSILLGTCWGIGKKGCEVYRYRIKCALDWISCTTTEVSALPFVSLLKLPSYNLTYCYKLMIGPKGVWRYLHGRNSASQSILAAILSWTSSTILLAVSHPQTGDSLKATQATPKNLNLIDVIVQDNAVPSTHWRLGLRKWSFPTLTPQRDQHLKHPDLGIWHYYQFALLKLGHSHEITDYYHAARYRVNDSRHTCIKQR